MAGATHATTLQSRVGNGGGVGEAFRFSPLPGFPLHRRSSRDRNPPYRRRKPTVRVGDVTPTGPDSYGPRFTASGGWSAGFGSPLKRDALGMSCDIAPRFLPEPKCGFLALLPGLGVGDHRGNNGGGAAREARTAGDDHATMLRRRRCSTMRR